MDFFNQEAALRISLLVVPNKLVPSAKSLCKEKHIIWVILRNELKCKHLHAGVKDALGRPRSCAAGQTRRPCHLPLGISVRPQGVWVCLARSTELRPSSGELETSSQWNSLERLSTESSQLTLTQQGGPCPELWAFHLPAIIKPPQVSSLRPTVSPSVGRRDPAQQTRPPGRPELQHCCSHGERRPQAATCSSEIREEGVWKPCGWTERGHGPQTREQMSQRRTWRKWASVASKATDPWPRVPAKAGFPSQTSEGLVSAPPGWFGCWRYVGAQRAVTALLRGVSMRRQLSPRNPQVCVSLGATSGSREMGCPHWRLDGHTHFTLSKMVLGLHCF